MLMGNFKSTEVVMSTFDFEFMIKKPTCFQSAHPNYIDLILTNKNSVFQKHQCF